MTGSNGETAAPSAPSPVRDLVRIGGAGFLTGEIDPLGAQLYILRDSFGTELLWDGNPEYWTGRAPILFPIVGRLHRDRYRLNGETYHLDKHGFARHMPFDIELHRPDQAVLRLTDTEQTRLIYPFSFELSIGFCVDACRLHIDVAIENRSDTLMPASFGFHPALRWPLDPTNRRTDHTLVFSHPESAPVWRINSDDLLSREEPTPIVGNVMALTCFSASASAVTAYRSELIRESGRWLAEGGSLGG